MSIHRLYLVECDGLSCGVSVQTTTDDFDEANNQAQAKGLVYDAETDEHYCANCAGTGD